MAVRMWKVVRREVDVVERTYYVESDSRAGAEMMANETEYTSEECQIGTDARIILVEDMSSGMSQEMPAQMCCHNLHCLRFAVPMIVLQATKKHPDPFWFSYELNTWMCPACGGTDVY